MGTSVGAKLRRALRTVVHTLRDLPARWRRSLQFRVVSVTMVLSLAVAVGLGYFIAQRVADGIMSTRLDAAKSQASDGFESAQQAFSAKSVDASVDTSVIAQSVARQLCHGALFQVVVIAKKSTDNASSFPAACSS